MSVRHLVSASALALLGGCGASAVNDSLRDETIRDSAGIIVEGGELGVLRLRPGDCFDEGSTESVELVVAVPCDVAHDSEVLAVFGLPEAGWPGAAAVAEASIAGCEERVPDISRDVAGIEDAKLLVLAPEEASWDDDRSVICVAVADDGRAFVRSLIRVEA